MTQTIRSGRSAEEMYLLMAYADGELDSAERARVEDLIAADPEARALVGDLSAIATTTHEWVHEAANASGARRSLVDSFDIADGVMAKIASDATVASTSPSTSAEHRPMAKPIDLAARRRANAARTTGILTTLAVAAAALFVIHSRSEDAMNASNVQMNTAQSAAVGSDPATQGSPAGGAVTAGPADPAALAENMPLAAPAVATGTKAGEIEVNSVGARSNDVTVFYPQAGDTTASVVVWIDDSNP